MVLWFFILNKCGFQKDDFRSKANSGKQKQTNSFCVMIQWANNNLFKFKPENLSTAFYDP